MQSQQEDPPSPSNSTRNAQQDRNKVLKGREYQDFSLDPQYRNAPGSVLHTLPDITSNTRILAVCGVEDDINNMASPKKDGWFISDFYAWKHVLKGAGSSQKWLTCEEPKYLVERFEEYLHGSHFYERKIVLNKTELEKPGFVDNIVLATRGNLKPKFTEVLKEEAAMADKNDQPLCVFIFAHGDYNSDYGCSLGAEVEENLFGISDFKSVVGPGIRVTICSTACYSGGWAVYHDFLSGRSQQGAPYKDIGQELNASVLTAAGPSSMSESYGASASLGRHCGSYFVSALLNVYRQECEAAEAADPSSPSSSAPTPKDISYKQDTFLKFTEKVYDTMARLDRKASIHQIRFAAQDDDWLTAWGPRSGLPLVDFKNNWDELESVMPTQDPTNLSNRGIPLDSNAPDPSSSGQTGKYGSFRGRPGPLEMKVKALRHECKSYLSSFPGSDGAADNVVLHGLVRDFLNGKYNHNDEEFLDQLDKMVLYRNALTSLATALLASADITGPKSLTCARFSSESLQQGLPSHLRQKYDLAFRVVAQSGIFHNPDKSEGRKFVKPIQYMAAALTLDGNIVSPTQMTAAVDKIKLIYHKNVIEKLKKEVDNAPEVRRTKETWYNSMRKRLRSLSPSKTEKRRSIGSVSSGLGMLPDLMRRNSGKDRSKGKGPADRRGRP